MIGEDSKQPCSSGIGIDEIDEASSFVKVGAILEVTSGEFAGYDVAVLSVNEMSKTATVALAVFGGTDATPFEIGFSELRAR